MNESMGDFTFWISLSPRPKLNLSDEVWSQSRLWISWADIGFALGWSIRSRSLVYFSTFKAWKF